MDFASELLFPMIFSTAPRCAEMGLIFFASIVIDFCIDATSDLTSS